VYAAPNEEDEVVLPQVEDLGLNPSRLRMAEPGDEEELAPTFGDLADADRPLV
jgi:hypothetical protein